MKKSLKVFVSVIVLLLLGAIGLGFYFKTTPEYALMNIYQDINKSGIEGLYLHLTGEAKDTVETITEVTENRFVNSIMGLFDKNDYMGVLKSEIQNIEWDVEGILKNKKSATVMLDFNYEDKLTGNIQFSMLREKNGWKINELKFPKINDINW